MSNTTFLGIVALLVVAFIAWVFSARPEMALYAGGGVIGFATLVILGNWLFGALFPDSAAVGGPEYERLRHRQMGTRDQPHIVDMHNVEPPPLLPKRPQTDGK
ncbi:MAG: hypothetical protein AAB403_20060 [Planctomycetota bacterium]